jgi:hypothetical protein
MERDNLGRESRVRGRFPLSVQNFVKKNDCSGEWNWTESSKHWRDCWGMRSSRGRTLDHSTIHLPLMEEARSRAILADRQILFRPKNVAVRPNKKPFPDSGSVGVTTEPAAAAAGPLK